MCSVVASERSSQRRRSWRSSPGAREIYNPPTPAPPRRCNSPPWLPARAVASRRPAPSRKLPVQSNPTHGVRVSGQFDIRAWCLRWRFVVFSAIAILSRRIQAHVMAGRSPPRHRHDGSSPLPLGVDASPAPARWVRLPIRVPGSDCCVSDASPKVIDCATGQGFDQIASLIQWSTWLHLRIGV